MLYSAIPVGRILSVMCDCLATIGAWVFFGTQLRLCTFLFTVTLNVTRKEELT